MAEPQPFEELIRRVRAGDQAAAAEVVRRYEPTIRRVIRLRLTDDRLCALLDSMDICQSVLASFFLRAASGQYELDTPENLLKLLTSMARHKLADQARKLRTQRRDERRVEGGRTLDEVAAGTASPIRTLEARDLLAEVERRLSAEERRLVELRMQGLDWVAIAQQLEGGAEALRKKLSRALDRVSRELGLEDG
jgi:RNA polymerase sigma-70 factor (ECF subfamily)